MLELSPSAASSPRRVGGAQTAAAADVPRTIHRDEVRRLLASGAQIVDVLPPEEFAHAHIAGAMNLPLKELTAALATARLDPRRPVVVYCYDST
jgi:rhodanese-related sulfurtransferase